MQNYWDVGLCYDNGHQKSNLRELRLIDLSLSYKNSLGQFHTQDEQGCSLNSSPHFTAQLKPCLHKSL